MKNNFTSLLLVFFALMLLTILSCKKDIIQDIPDDSLPITDINEIQVEDSFNWSTTKNVVLNIEARTNDNQPLKKIRMSVYAENPLDENFEKTDAKIIFSGFTDDYGLLTASINLPTIYNKVYIMPNYIGLNNLTEVSVVQGIASYVFGGKIIKNGMKSLYQKNEVKRMTDAKGSLLTMGTWSSTGLPNYLVASDVVSSGLLTDINASLPENDPLPNSHPQYLVAGNQANIVLKDSADIWVTFVHEGAGYRNVLGYYTYQKGNDPQTINDLTNMTVIFPNVSYSGSGGSLTSGAKVYLGSFAANTVIGYFILANGYNTSNYTINTAAPTYFSNSILNPEATTTLKQHMIMLNDEARDLLILGFEDINRGTSSCDQDFNDAIFYITANPITAVETEDVPEIDTPGDTDNDGVTDKFDDYPTDPSKAMNNYYPAEGSYGTLAFEDLWPARGDYDFNDLVLDYQFNQITNADNKIVQVNANLVARAIGAGYHNGFGFQMDILPSDVQNVTGLDLRYNYITLLSNNVESGHNKATIIPFDNAFNVLPSQGGTFINTIIGNPVVIPDTQHITIVFTSPKTTAQVGSPPYNPFLIANKIRGKEIHLPGYPPTALANAAFFGTDDDNTNLSTGNYYKSEGNLPWAMNLPASFVYPREKSSIVQGHLKFGNWAQSSGYSFMDWYDNKLGYRNTAHLFSF